MNIPNLGYLYFKEYYMEYFERNNNENIDLKNNQKMMLKYWKDKEKDLLEFTLSECSDTIGINEIIQSEENGKDFLYFKTTYPGVLIGSGLIHSIGVDGESKLGFQFDYTTGLPIINGSSVKGTLRNIFDLVDKKDEVVQYLKDIILNLKPSATKDLNREYLKKIRDEIFEGVEDGKNKPINERDIFYEAVIDIEETRKIKNGIQILGEDYITPHKNPLKNPNPIKFIKLMPNLIIRFQFDLKDGRLTKDEKLKLFDQIILDFGIGAKTNVGYGRFDKHIKK